jgi:alkaline phosphatase
LNPEPTLPQVPWTEPDEVRMDRREWLKTGAVVGAGLLGGGVVSPARAFSLDPSFRPGARNVIFFAWDGLTWEDMGTARYYRMRRGEPPLRMERLLDSGASGSMLVHSLTSVVTDSSAASSAWSTGRKIVNQAVSEYPDGTRLATILELARDRGLATGLITTTRMTHATPAGWLAHVPHRDMEDEIAVQYLEARPDVLLGGGSVHFDPQVRIDGRDLFQEFRDAGYQVIRTAEELPGASGSRLLGIFTPGHVAYEIDRVRQGEASPSLAQMTRKGLEVLEGFDQGFVVQIEAGRVDHANHENDPGGALHDILAGDEALEVVLDFADRRGDTLVIVGSDHGTGSGVVYGTGSGYRGSSQAFDRIDLQRASYRHFLRAMGPGASPNRVREGARDLLGVELSDERADLVARVLSREVRLGNLRAHRDQPYNGLHQALTDDSPRVPGLNVNYATGQHTSGPVPLAFYGVGVEARGLGIVDNTELFGVMLWALGLSHENPVMTEEEALRIQEAAGPARPAEDRPHWV